MTTLTEFLLARIAENEAAAKDRMMEVAPLRGGCRGIGCLRRSDQPHAFGCPARVLAECAAKRRIVELHKAWPVLVETQPEFSSASGDDANAVTLRMSKQIAWTTEQEYRDRFGDEPPTGPILRILAAIYADHPAFDPEWAL